MAIIVSNTMINSCYLCNNYIVKGVGFARYEVKTIVNSRSKLVLKVKTILNSYCFKDN